VNPEIRLQPINKANSESFDSFAPAHADPPEEDLPILCRWRPPRLRSRADWPFRRGALAFFARLPPGSLLQCASRARLMPTTSMKAFRSFTSVVCVVLCICGCATSGADRVVQIGPSTYKLVGVGNSTDSSGNAVKARLYRQAAEFCRGKGGEMIPLNSTAQDSKPGQSASAEIRFKCVSASR